MKECIYRNKCAFFNDELPMKASQMRLYKRHFCSRESDRCALYRVRRVMGKKGLPMDLYPHMLQRADEILVEG